MKKSYIILSSVLVFSLFTTPELSAQSFWRKMEAKAKTVVKEIDKASKEVDKVLGTEENTTSTADAQQDNAISSSKMVIRPHLAKDTKVIYMDKIENSDGFSDFANGLAFVKNQKTNRWGVMDTNRNLKIGFVFNTEMTKYGKIPFPRFQSGVCLVSTSIVPYERAKNSAFYAIIIDRDGNVVKGIPGVDRYTNFEDGIAHVKMALVDTK